MANLTASADVFVRRDVQRVWEYLADITNLSRWADGITEPRWLTPARGAGATFASRYTYAGRTHDIAYEIVESVPLKRQTVRSTSGPFPYRGTFDVAGEGGGTRVRHTMTAGSDGGCTAAMFVMLGPLLRLATRRRLRTELERLRAALES